MSQPKLTIALVGNPNCGKTTLFNALTGARQTVGNWPGVTVERKSGHYEYRPGQARSTARVEVVDLPGVYAMDAIPGATSLDQQVTHDYVLGGEADLIVNILDASNLERNLYLTTQLLELGRPMVVALNMVDAAKEKGISIDVEGLSRRLDCPVVSMTASSGEGIADLKATVAAAGQRRPGVRAQYPPQVERAVEVLAASIQLATESSLPKSWVALKLMEGDMAALRLAGPHLQEEAAFLRRQLEGELGEELDIIAADARYQFIGEIAGQLVHRREQAGRNLTRALDRIVLNRLVGLPIFFGIMYFMFLFTINLGGAFIDFFDQLFGAIFVDGLGALMAALGSPDWLTVLIADGAGGGVQTVATFIPVIAFLFLFLSFLEDSGYMARAAFVMDRLMRALGLPGKSFVPLIVGFGCNVPAVMATRTLENPRDRMMTMAMTPFMSCGARLPVYALFAAAFFPTGGQNMVFLLYLVGVAAAIFTALALKRTLLPGEGANFVMELPNYHLPTVKGLLLHTWERLKGFATKASRVIVPMVLVLNVLNSLGTDGSFGHQKDDRSVLAAVGKAIVPAFSPIGLTEQNWPAAVGVFTGVLAKEAVVGTLNTLYSQQADANAAAAGEGGAAPQSAASFDLIGAVAGAFATIPVNLAGLTGAALDPLGLDIGDLSDQATAAEAQAVDAGTFGAMAKLFDGTAGAFAYLLLVLLYFPCAAVVGAVHREAGLRWAGFIALWSTGIGYGTATVYYQLATLASHPVQSLVWTAAILLTLIAGLFTMKRWANRLEAAPRIAIEAA